MRAVCEMRRNQELLDKHPWKLWEGKDGNWYTYIVDPETEIRKLKKRKTREELEKVVIKHYMAQGENPLVKDIYKEWINGKVERQEVEIQTRNRYDRVFALCFDKIANRKIKEIKDYEVEEFVLSSIHEFNMSAKGYSNFRTLVYGIFRYAKKRHLVEFSITELIQDIEVPKKSLKKTIIRPEDLVFNEVEAKTILNYLARNYRSVVDLGIMLLFKSGLRPGELAALKREDINGNIIHVSRTEVKWQDEDGTVHVEVRDHPKTEAGVRDVVIPTQDVWILRKIDELSEPGEWLFMKSYGRVPYESFKNRLNKVEDKLHIHRKSLNKIRKTYATVLMDNNVEESVITSQMGHTDINTTRKFYYKDRHDLNQKIIAIDKIRGL